jgi:hypothetical protein
LTMKEFEVPTGSERPTLPHNVFEHDENLPVIDVATLLPGSTDTAARAASLAAMLDAAKTWGFFKIRNHGVPLEVVPTPPILVVPISKRLAPPGISYCII